ncbi:MAG: hypothetical protein AAB605_03320 [Patescibacteria group bacterium]
MRTFNPLEAELATATILYRLPDFPHILQSYIWQDYDNPPQFPRLCDFLDFWKAEVEGELYRVEVTSSGLLVPRIRTENFSIRIH